MLGLLSLLRNIFHLFNFCFCFCIGLNFLGFCPYVFIVFPEKEVVIEIILKNIHSIGVLLQPLLTYLGSLQLKLLEQLNITLGKTILRSVKDICLHHLKSFIELFIALIVTLEKIIIEVLFRVIFNNIRQALPAFPFLNYKGPFEMSF